MSEHVSNSRRKVAWKDAKGLTESQKFIETNIQKRYDERHPALLTSGEDVLINSHTPVGCPFCGSVDFFKFGKTKNNVTRYRCKDCRKTFTPLTGTIFDSHKIPITEWIEYSLNLFRHVSITASSWNNRNAFTTSRYWLEKILMLLEDIQKDIVLSGTVWLDETYILYLNEKAILTLKRMAQSIVGTLITSIA